MGSTEGRQGLARLQLHYLSRLPAALPGVSRNRLGEVRKYRRDRLDFHLARIPQEHGVDNVYAEIGTSFAMCATANPRIAAALLGTYIKGMGADHVCWGTDSLFYGSPQWQIEALHRLEIPEDMQKKHGFAPLGGATSATKNAIFGYNSARLFDLDLTTQRADYGPLPADTFGEIQEAYRLAGGMFPDTAAGYIAKRSA